jgi:putative DNA primase/helicase
MDVASTAIGKHVIASPAICDVTALWCLFTHFIHHMCIELPIAPRLEIRAVSPQAGKTTLLTLTTCLVCRPLPAASLTPAVVYRAVDKFKPTLVLDEVDAQLRSNRNPELNAVLRASHSRHFAQIPRNVRAADDWDIELFSCWGSYCYTTLGRIGDEALESRAIRVTLLRATPAELKALEPLDDGTSPVLVECGRKFARWAQDQTALPDAAIPDSILARDRDNWRPLFRLVAQIGGEWPQRAHKAAIVINGVTRAIGDVVPLLADIREVFGAREKMSTRELVDGLRALPEPSLDWDRAYRGQPINEYFLRARLKGLVEVPVNGRRWRDGERMIRGYRKSHFDDAFSRYLLPEDDEVTDVPDDGADAISFSPPVYTADLSVASDTPLKHNGKDPAHRSVCAGSSSVAADQDVSAPDAYPAQTDCRPSSVAPGKSKDTVTLRDAAPDETDKSAVCRGEKEKKGDSEIWSPAEEDC